MRSFSTRLIILLLCFGLPVSLLTAQAPEKEENFVYAISAFDGKDYAGTFTREASDTIYLIAQEENFINTRKTLVYYWPITREWKTDYDTLNENFLNGKIELTDASGETEMLEPVKYTYYNYPNDYLEINWQVFIGEEAEREYAEYQKTMEAYWEAVDKYQRESMRREMEFQKMVEEIGQRRKQGLETKDLVEKLQNMADEPRPEPPQRPGVYVRPVDRAFLFQLDPGEYKIRFLWEDGSVMEGSEKTVIVHSKRRENSIGYEVIPADKWTRPEMSQTPSSVLYVDGTTDLYLRPFFQDEFNDLYYNKTTRNDAKGNPELMKWVRIQQVPEARIEMILPKQKTESITEKPYYVEQLKGSALGYRIVPYDPDGKHKDKEPSLKAYHVPLGPDTPVIRLKLQNESGEYHKGGRREIRVVSQSGIQLAGLPLSFLPLVIMIAVLVARSRKYE